MIQRHKDDSGRDGKMDQKTQRDINRHGGTACESGGNKYKKPLEIVVNGISHYFDCFECAIHKLAPKCNHCGCMIIGHGVEAGGSFFCCAHCAEKQGVADMVDRA